MRRFVGVRASRGEWGGVLAGASGLLLLAFLSLLPAPLVARTPATPLDPIQQGMEEARGLERLGRPEEAIQKLRQLHATHPDNADVVRALGRKLAEAGRPEQALALYREAMPKLTDSGPVLVELERLYREKKDFQAAFEVCLEYHERFGERGRWVAEEMESLLRTDKIGVEALALLEAAISRHPDDTALRDLLVTGLFHSGQTDRALSEAASLDERQKAKGTVLFRYARLAEEKQAFLPAIAALDRTLEAGASDRLREEVLYRKAHVLRKLRRVPESLAAFELLLQEFPQGKFRQRVLLEKAQALAHELNQREEALQAYSALLTELRPGQPSQPEPRGRRDEGKDSAKLADEIRLAMADCHLKLGRPAEAAKLYQELSEQASGPEARVSALFQIGEMHFYQGQTKEAEDAYYKLTDLYPQGPWVNDALERILLLGENADHGSVPLAAIAQAEYQRRLGNLEKGLVLIADALSQFSDSRAADDLRLRQARFLLELGRPEVAKSVVDTLAASYPESPLAPRGLKEVADHYRASTGGSPAAEALYQEILVKFPQSLEAPAARAALQEMKEKSKDSSERIEALEREQRQWG